MEVKWRSVWFRGAHHSEKGVVLDNVVVVCFVVCCVIKNTTMNNYCTVSGVKGEEDEIAEQQTNKKSDK